MKLLFDQNLSPKLVQRLSDLYSGSRHLQDFGLSEKGDLAVWDFAAYNGFAIVSKDDDFHHLSFVRGAPPKVLGLHLGNCNTSTIEALLRQRSADVLAFLQDEDSAFLPLF